MFYILIILAFVRGRSSRE